MDKDMILWLVLFIAFLIIEAITVALTCIWFAAGSLLALIASFFDVNIWVEIGLFAVSSILLMIYTKPVLTKRLLKPREKTNYESVIGEKARVTEQISNIDNKGTVAINGLEWSARSVDNKIINVDETVEIVKVEGVKVIVKK